MNTQRPNPCGLAYSRNTNVPLYAQHGALLIPGRVNLDDPAFAGAQAAGALIAPYLDPIEVPDDGGLGGADTAFYAGCPAGQQLWPYPTYGVRINYPGTHLADIRAGSTWSDLVVQRITDRIRSGKYNGTLVDIAGGRLWSPISDWLNWPQAERDAWTLGCIDIMRRVREAIQKYDASHLLINNNTWDRGDLVGFAGEQHINGFVLEHRPFNAYHQNYVGRKVGPRGCKRAVIVIAAAPGDVAAWTNMATDGPNWITDQQTPEYARPNKPCLPFQRLDYSRQP